MMKNKSANYGQENREYDVRRPQYRLGFKILSKVQIKGKKVLDAGCGMGEFADMLSKKGFQVVCVDGTERCFESARRRGHESYKIDLENQKLPFKDNEFDIVASLAVVGHLWNTSHYLNEIRRVLKPDGCAIITEGNYESLNFRINHLFGNFGNIIYKSSHKKFYNFITFKKEISRFFKIKESIGIPFLPIIPFNNKFQNLLSTTIGVLGIPKKRLKKNL